MVKEVFSRKGKGMWWWQYQNMYSYSSIETYSVCRCAAKVELPVSLFLEASKREK